MTRPDPPAQAAGEELSSAESRLVAAAATGKLLTLEDGRPEPGGARHGRPAAPRRAGGQPIRAEVLAGLLTGERQPNGRLPRYVRMRGARITGSLDLMGATLACPLWLQDCLVDQPVILSEATAPSIRLTGCRVPALAADGLRTAGDLTMDGNFTVQDDLLLRGARIGGSLSLSGARITRLAADMITVEQAMSFRDGSATGQVCLAGARIGGELDFTSASLANPGGTALLAERLSVSGNMTCAGGFTVTGEIRLSGARIGGNLDLGGARLSNPGGLALVADSMTVAQCLFCRGGFTADGQVRMLSAQVGEAFSLEGATLSNPGHADALYAVRLTVGGDLFARRGFTARGALQLSGARVSGLIDLTGAILANPGGQALDLYAASVTELHLLPRQPPEGIVNLTNAKVGAFADDQSTWPAAVLLRGFSYDSLHNDTAGVRARLGWLARDPGGYAPEIYDQLAAAYRRAGREDAARQAGIAKQRQRRQALSPAGRLLNWLLYLTVGYGYRTWMAGAWLVALSALSTWAFTRIRMIPGTPGPAAFSPFGYSLDLLLPIADLGQKNNWQPSGDYLYLAWLLRAAGWALTTAVVAAVSGILKRD